MDAAHVNLFWMESEFESAKMNYLPTNYILKETGDL